MNKEELIYEGKAKCILRCEDDDYVIVYYKDSATAFNGVKKAELKNKGVLNNKITALIFNYLNNMGIYTHFIKRIDEVTQICKKVDIIPLEFICRNVVAGSMAKRLGLDEGIVLDCPILEICYKNDELNDPLINNCHAVALNIVSESNLKKCYEITLKVNELLKNLFSKINIKLIDFKLEFGFDNNNNLVLADEFSPDNCRLWEMGTNRKLDKDLFRRDMGDITVTYEEVLSKLEKLMEEDNECR